MRATGSERARREAGRGRDGFQHHHAGALVENAVGLRQLPAGFASLGDYNGVGGHEQEQYREHVAARRSPGSVHPRLDGPNAAAWP